MDYVFYEEEVGVGTDPFVQSALVACGNDPSWFLLPQSMIQSGAKMDDARLRYRSTTKTLCYKAATKSGELLSKTTGLDLSRIVRSGTYDGEPVEDAVVVFVDRETAALNADPLSFLGVGSEGPDGLVKSTANFEKRADFGLADE